MFCQKEVYRDSKRYWYPPHGFVVPSTAYFRSMYRKLVENPRYTFVWHFLSDIVLCQKEVYRDSVGSLLLVLSCPQADFSMYRKPAKYTGIPLIGIFELIQV